MEVVENERKDPSYVGTELLREKIRKYTIEHRKQLHEKNYDALRTGLGDMQHLNDLTEKDVVGIAGRIKRRKHATNEDMYRLSYAFLQRIENIRSFAKIAGAINVLVKELTGKDAERQMSACECLCNLSLGEEAVCEKIVNMAGSYLIIYLDSNEDRLKRTSLWIIANILATKSDSGVVGGKAAITLIKMELFPKLWHLYTADDQSKGDRDYSDDTGICLQLISVQAKRMLRPQDYKFLCENLNQKNPTGNAGEYYLQIIFHCNIIQPDVTTCILSEQQKLFLINCAVGNIQNCSDFNSQSNRLRIFYAVRILANLLPAQPQTYPLLLQQLSTVWQTNLVELFNKLFLYKNHYLTQETVWLLKNLLHQQEVHQQGAMLKDNWLDKLKVFNNNNNNNIVVENI